jgi:ABC-type lipoprotein release transport system permease subunit
VVTGFFVVLMGLILTIACMNLATMLLARGANRRKELAIRLGVGASRSRLVRQMISEGILLSLLGGVAGLALAYALSVLNSHLPQPAGRRSRPISLWNGTPLSSHSRSQSFAASDSVLSRLCKRRKPTFTPRSKKA